MTEINNTQQSKEDDAKLPLFYALLSMPIICFYAVVLYLAEDGESTLDFFGHSPLVGFLSLFFFFSFPYNFYSILKSLIQWKGIEKTPAFITLAYIFSYQAYLTLSYFTYGLWSSVYTLNLIVVAAGILFLVLLLYRVFRYLKSV